MRASIRGFVALVLGSSCGPQFEPAGGTDGTTSTGDPPTLTASASLLTESGGAETATEAVEETTGAMPSLCIAEYPLPALDAAAGSTVGFTDFDGDGRWEVWHHKGSFDPTVRVLAIASDGTTTVRAEWGLDGVPQEALDVDGDGVVDLVVAFGDDLAWHRVMGADLELDQAVLPFSAPEGLPKVWRDLNGDGKTDVIVRGHSSTDYTIALGDGEGAFVHAETFSFEPPGAMVGILAAGPSQFALIFHQGMGDWGTLTFEVGADGTLETLGIVESERIRPIDARDRNGDGRPDLVMRRSLGHSVRTSLLLSKGQAFEEHALDDVDWAVAGTFSGAGEAELMVGRGENVELWRGAVVPTDEIEPIGGKLLPPWASSQSAPHDFDGDGSEDLIIWRTYPHFLVRIVPCDG